MPPATRCGSWSERDSRIIAKRGALHTDGALPIPLLTGRNLARPRELRNNIPWDAALAFNLAAGPVSTTYVALGLFSTDRLRTTWTGSAQQLSRRPAARVPSRRSLWPQPHRVQTFSALVNQDRGDLPSCLILISGIEEPRGAGRLIQLPEVVFSSAKICYPSRPKGRSIYFDLPRIGSPVRRHDDCDAHA